MPSEDQGTEHRDVEQRLTSVIPMALNVPIGMHVIHVILLVATNLYLLEPPLRKVGVRRAQIAVLSLMAESESRRQRMDSVHLVLGPLLDIIDDLHDPIVLKVADRRVSVTRHLVVELCDRGRDRVRVQVSACGAVYKTDDVSVVEELDRAVGVNVRFIPAWSDYPVIVYILVVVASNLLLIGADGVCLDVRMQKAASPARIF